MPRRSNQLTAWVESTAAANCFPQNLALFADKLLGTQSVYLFRGRHKKISLEVLRPDAIFIVPIVPFIPCGSTCKLILYAAHLKGANYISPLDNMSAVRRLTSFLHFWGCVREGEAIS